ncbi:nuclease-related domain-containing protein [Clostridium celatum]|uniref:Topoisomerase DNA-binding C4 zinc finger domain protein n=1 Tax=Clostridium celatum DSM 1785 TaxID=545697 RepID=L1Q270_9CLOT|nr:nuclease-related domain-containing protein [Clostridium celatum]EKY22068.1 topoisomerase DNA-binding C4 zinc finger domain protein [Clostridium celatum DSM 1785]MCE9654501.1 NERD domain-containing protein [Clostridium celatum]MDU3722956.1 NERD domain-containing protein [Clostridium celatum]MDU6296397.1 NERD domain-containing protein [Clostridium celatum]MDY3359881.1 NERD domain-containing protein [Clostridium celatum]
MKIKALVGILIILLTIINVYKSKVKGYIGEIIVSKRLSKLNKKKYKVINNILLKAPNTTTQIDHIVISIYGIFVIETKNYKGIIKGNEYDHNWIQILFNKKETLRNPIKQNNGHIIALKNIIPELKYKKINSIIAFTKRAKLNINVETDVVYCNKINRIIKKNKEREFTIEEVNNIYGKLKELNINSLRERKVHIKSIKRSVKKAKKRLNKNRCPRCGGKLKKRHNRYGSFKGCKNYPGCTFRMEY